MQAALKTDGDTPSLRREAPAFGSLALRPGILRARDLQALVLVPTRELALQVSDEVRALGRDRAIKVATLFGGQSIERQFADLRRHPQVAVATPGRLLGHTPRRTLARRPGRTGTLAAGGPV